MIMGSLFRRAENAVENILDQALARIMVAVPLLVAAGFATAAASGYLNARYGSETGNLIMAAGFTVLGLLVAGYVATWSSGQSAAEAEADASGSASNGEQVESSVTGQPASMSESERELFNAMLASAAPIALPGLIRILLRNIPLLLAVLVSAYVLSRPTGTDDAGTAAVQGS
jgi:hypothetical protein